MRSHTHNLGLLKIGKSGELERKVRIPPIVKSLWNFNVILLLMVCCVLEVLFLTTTRFCFMCLKVGSSLLLNLISQGMYLKPVQTWHKLISRTFRSILWVNHEEHVRETCAEISTVCVVMPR